MLPTADAEADPSPTALTTADPSATSPKPPCRRVSDPTDAPTRIRASLLHALNNPLCIRRPADMLGDGRALFARSLSGGRDALETSGKARGRCCASAGGDRNQ